MVLWMLDSSSAPRPSIITRSNGTRFGSMLTTRARPFFVRSFSLLGA